MTQVQVRVREADATKPAGTEEVAGPSIAAGWWLAHADLTIVSELTHWGWLTLLAGVVLAVNGACCLILH